MVPPSKSQTQEPFETPALVFDSPLAFEGALYLAKRFDLTTS